MAGVAMHRCPRTDDDGRPLAPDMVTCGICNRSWCERCDGAPSALCHYCHGRGYSNAPIPPRQARELARPRGHVCAFVSDGTPGQGDHHSRDIVAVYHGATVPVHVCGFHASRPDIMAKVYASLGKR